MWMILEHQQTQFGKLLGLIEFSHILKDADFADKIQKEGLSAWYDLMYAAM